VLHIIMLVAMPLFATAGFWQLRRLDEKRTKNALIIERRDLPPVTSLADDDLEFRRAQLEGRFGSNADVFLTGRPLNGRSGDHVLTPFETEDGTIIVDRGWVPAGDEGTPTPTGEVSLSGVLLPSEGRAPFTSGRSSGPRATRAAERGVAPVVRRAVVPVHPHRDRRVRACAATGYPLGATDADGAGVNSKMPASRLRRRSRHVVSSASSA
jgi:cytochrome oxidase assembly protein ShyY1